MQGCMVQPPDYDANAGTCGSWAVIPYFVSFFLAVPLILLELFKAVIIDNFESEQVGQGGPCWLNGSEQVGVGALPRRRASWWAADLMRATRWGRGQSEPAGASFQVTFGVGSESNTAFHRKHEPFLASGWAGTALWEGAGWKYCKLESQGVSRRTSEGWVAVLELLCSCAHQLRLTACLSVSESQQRKYCWHFCTSCAGDSRVEAYAY